MTWLATIKGISDLITIISGLIKNNRATRDLLLRELSLNMKAFETAQKSIQLDYDKLLELLSNERIRKAREDRFVFNSIKHGIITKEHCKDDRNRRYVGKNCDWLFKSIDEKIADLHNQKKYHGSLNSIEKSNVSLQFSNLFYKMKLLIEFIQ